MPSSNFKLFDENKQNILTSEEYNGSTARLNGVQAGIASSKLHNKSMYQQSLMAYALAQIMVENGIDASDEDAVATFIAKLRNSIGLTALDKCFSKLQSLSSSTAALIDSVDPPSTPDAALIKLLGNIAAVPTQYCEIVQYTGTGTSESITRLAQTTYAYSGYTWHSVAGLMLDKTITFSREPKAVFLLSMQYAQLGGEYKLLTQPANAYTDTRYFNLQVPFIFNFNKPSNFPISYARQIYDINQDQKGSVQLSQQVYDDLYYAYCDSSRYIMSSSGIHKDGNVVKLYSTLSVVSPTSYEDADAVLMRNGNGVNITNCTYAAIALF